MRMQNLREDNKYNIWSIESCLAHVRGWAENWRWEFSVRKTPLDPILKFIVDIGGENEREIMFIVGIFGCSLYLTINNLVPKRFQYIWSTRGKNGEFLHENNLGRTYGFYWTKECLVLSWHSSNAGSSTRKPNPYGWSKFIHMPWELDHSGTQYMDKNFQWQDEKNWEDRKKLGIKYEAPYKYTLASGEVQERTAEIYVYRMQWHLRFFYKYFGLKIGPRLRRQSIDVSFSDEVGERSGSWKGGCTGCSYEMKKGELPLATLRRMQRERKFN